MRRLSWSERLEIILRMVKKGITPPSEQELAELSEIIIPEKTSREEERLLEGQERSEQIEAHIDTLDVEEKEKVDQFVKEKQTNSKPKLTDAQIRKRFQIQLLIEKDWV